MQQTKLATVATVSKRITCMWKPS